MRSVREQLSTLVSEERGVHVVEIDVMRNGKSYRMVGVLMEVDGDTVRIAFSSKNDEVVDELVLATEEIVSIRPVKDNEIQKLL